MQIIKKIMGKKHEINLQQNSGEFTKANNENNGIKQQKLSNISSSIHYPHQDLFKTDYLGRLGIIKNKKIEFNLVELVIQINKFLFILN